MFKGGKATQVAKLAQNATGNNAPDTGNTAQQIIVRFVMFSAIATQFVGHLSFFFVQEPEGAHPPLEGGLGCGVGENHSIHPVSEIMAPFVFIELFGNADAKIEKLHLDPALIATYVLHQIVASPEKATECLTLYIGHLYSVEPIVLEFPCDQLGIDTVGL